MSMAVQDVGRCSVGQGQRMNFTEIALCACIDLNGTRARQACLASRELFAPLFGSTEAAHAVAESPKIVLC